MPITSVRGPVTPTIAPQAIYSVVFAKPTFTYHVIGPGNNLTYCGSHPDRMVAQGVFPRITVSDWDRGSYRMCRICFTKYNRSRSI